MSSWFVYGGFRRSIYPNIDSHSWILREPRRSKQEDQLLTALYICVPFVAMIIVYLFM